jgi:RNA polymerase sigma-70 factor (ECF subfamily)
VDPVGFKSTTMAMQRVRGGKQQTADLSPLAELLSASAAGDRQAFARLYEATSAKLFGVILRIVGRRDRAEEALQEAYLRIWDHAADFDPRKGAPMTWMITIARNRACDWRRRDRGEAPVDDLTPLETAASGEPGPLDQAIAMDHARALQACLNQLEPTQRQCIVLAYRDGYTHQELAERLNAPLGTIKSWIRRGLLRLKECLER